MRIYDSENIKQACDFSSERIRHTLQDNQKDGSQDVVVCKIISVIELDNMISKGKTIIDSTVICYKKHSMYVSNIIDSVQAYRMCLMLQCQSDCERARKQIINDLNVYLKTVYGCYFHIVMNIVSSVITVYDTDSKNGGEYTFVI